MTSRYSSLSTDSTNSLIADRNKSRSESARSSSIFDNSGFNGICDDTNQLFENDSILQSWVRFKENVKKRMEETKDEINERRRIVESSIIEYTNALQNKVDEYGNDCIKEAENIIKTLEYNCETDNTINSAVPNAPNDVPIKFETPNDFQGSLKVAFGDLGSSAQRKRKKLITEGEEIASMNAHISTKDNKQCAISDVASSKDIIAITDRNNKTVKIFSKGGRLLSILNQKLLKYPEFITAITINGHELFFITDTGNNKIRIFDNDQFTHVGDFACQLEKPGACCFSKWNDRILVLDLLYKTINCFTVTGQRECSVPSHLNDPAYCNCSLNGVLVITDWKNNKLNFYNRKLSLVKVFNNKGINPGQLDRPFGVVFDQFDNLLIADKNNKRIQAFDDEGELRKVIIKFKRIDQPKLVMGITLNSDDDLIAADHQGKITTIRYLTNSMEFCMIKEDNEDVDSQFTNRSPRFGNYEVLGDVDNASLL